MEVQALFTTHVYRLSWRVWMDPSGAAWPELPRAPTPVAFLDGSSTPIDFSTISVFLALLSSFITSQTPSIGFGPVG